MHNEFFLRSLPLPSDTNEVFWYYLDWLIQGSGTQAYYLIIATSVLFFVGSCLYMGGMVEDLKQTLAALDDDLDTMAEKLSTEVAFHNHVLE